MSIRRRVWSTPSGEQREAWLADYRDQAGARRHRTFKRKRDAETWLAQTRVELGHGTHVADSASITLREAGELWLAGEHMATLEPATVRVYRQHLEHHIVPFLGSKKLSQLTVPVIARFRDELHFAGRSPTMVRSVIGSLGMLIADAQEDGLVVRNAVHEFRSSRRRRRGGNSDRHKARLRVGADIPSVSEVRALLAAASGKIRVFLLTAVFTGLRASELRGLSWDDVDLKRAELHVRQRADMYNTIGRPKSLAGERTVPLPPSVVRELREWKLVCPRKDGRLQLVFPTQTGNVDNRGNLVNRGLVPTMIAAGIVNPDGSAKYTGLHCLRHFYASWCINRKEDGGLGLPAKVVQDRLGHATVAMTLDVYGHMFPRGDDAAELAAAERVLLG